MKEEVFYRSITHGKMAEQEVFNQIKEDILSHPHNNYQIVVGTDSQTYNYTKVVSVIALIKVGYGGKWFHTIEMKGRPHSVREKLYYEASRSLDVAKRLTKFLYQEGLDFRVIVDVDMGESRSGKTYDLIKEIVGWVSAEGFECRYKPYSPVASTVADRVSK